jgi:hypothetical protein
VLSLSKHKIHLGNSPLGLLPNLISFNGQVEYFRKAKEDL